MEDKLIALLKERGVLPETFNRKLPDAALASIADKVAAAEFHTTEVITVEDLITELQRHSPETILSIRKDKVGPNKDHLLTKISFISTLIT